MAIVLYPHLPLILVYNSVITVFCVSCNRALYGCCSCCLHSSILFSVFIGFFFSNLYRRVGSTNPTLEKTEIKQKQTDWLLKCYSCFSFWPNLPAATLSSRQLFFFTAHLTPLHVQVMSIEGSKSRAARKAGGERANRNAGRESFEYYAAIAAHEKCPVVRKRTKSFAKVSLN